MSDLEHVAIPGGHLFRNMVLFGRLLRAAGIDVSPQQLHEWVIATELIDLRQRRDFRNSAQSLLVRHHEDLELFERAFDLFWQARDPRELAELDLGLMIQRTKRRTKRSRRQGVVSTDDRSGARESEEPHVEQVRTWSDSEVLRHRDFAELEASEVEQVKALISKMTWRFDERRTRRRVPARRGPFLDPRRSLRRSLQNGGELLVWATRERKRKRRPLVLLCDISGSMEPYSRILLQFLYCFSNGLQNVEAFVFGTRLTRITHHLKDRDVDAALKAVHEDVVDFGGGTRIGETLRTFNYFWSRRVLGQGAAVLVISDGWDRGDVEVLRREMDRLQRSAYRLIWLNPLLGSPRYEPLTRGIQAALPFIDDFLPVHNLASLEDLGRRLERLYRGTGQRVRRRSSG